MQPLPHQGRGLLRVGRQVRREFDLDARGLVQLDDPHAGRGLHRMMAVGDDEYIGGRRDGTKQRGAQSSGQPGGQGAPRDGRKVEGMSRHVAPPRSRCRLVVERNADQGTTKKPKPVSPDFLRTGEKKREPMAPVVMK